MVELADTADSKSAIRENVRVQVPPRAPFVLLMVLLFCLYVEKMYKIVDVFFTCCSYERCFFSRYTR